MINKTIEIAYRWTAFRSNRQFLMIAAAVVMTMTSPMAGIEIALARDVFDNQFKWTQPPRANEILRSEDSFTRTLTPLDIEIRVGRGSVSSRSDFLAYVGEQALHWESKEIERFQTAFRLIWEGLSRVIPAEDLRELLPESIHIIKTTGLEEGGAAYTRDNAIVFSRHMLQVQNLNRLAAHELFHVLSKSLSLKEQKFFFESVGYKVRGLAPESLPPSLRKRRITNPDTIAGVVIGSVLQNVSDQEKDVVSFFPLLVLKNNANAHKPPNNFADAIEWLGLVVREDKKGATVSFVEREEPEFEDYVYQERVAREIERYPERVQPEEIMAENFASLALGEPSRLGRDEVLTKMASTLRQLAEARRLAVRSH